MSQDLRHFVEILDTLDAIVWEAEAKTFDFTYVNESARRILGYAPEEWTGTPGFWSSIIHPDDRERTVAFCVEAARECRDHEFDYRAVAADGRTVWLHDVVRVVADDDGTPLLLRGVMTDITDRKEAEVQRALDIVDLRLTQEQLARSEERYRLLSELTSDYAWSLKVGEDFTTELEWATGAFERITGHSLEALGGNWQPLVHPDDERLVDHALRELLQGNQMDVELRLVRPDGQAVWVHAVARPIMESGRPVRFVGSARDITERKDAEHELRTSEGRFRAVFDRAPLGIATADLEGHAQLVNEAFVDMLGYSREQLRSMSFLDYTYPEDADRDWELYQQLQQGEIGHYEIEKRLLRADGSACWVYLVVTMIRDDDGEPLAGVAIVQDITERKRAEEDRERLQGQLLQSQKMEAVGRLAGGIAHDFNNILAAILNYAAFIEENPSDTDSVAADAGEILRAAKRAATLTRQLLMFSRRETPRLQRLDLNQVVVEYTKFLERTLGEDVDLHLELAPHAGPVLADRLHIEQILLNLAVNSRDAMPQGGSLTIRVRDIASTRVGLAVSDTGEGMPQDVAARAFEPFFTTKPAGQGTGLGLATVYGIAQSLGGTVELESAEGSGTKVEVLLPVADESAQGDQETSDVSTWPNRSLTILVVEDEDQLRGLVCRMLKKDGHKVIEASTAQQTLELGEQIVRSVDLVLTDVVLPGVSGIELARGLRERRSDLHVLYMSGYPADVIDAQGGIDGPLLEKPFTIAELRRAISSELEKD